MIDTNIKINIFDMAKNVDKSDSNSSRVDIELFCDVFFINTILLKSDAGDLFSERVKAYWQQNWLCDDELVGVVFYYLDNEFVALSVQDAKKSSTDIELASEEAFFKLKSFINSLLSSGTQFIATLSSDYTINTYYNLTARHEFLSHHENGVYNGRPAKAFPKLNLGYQDSGADNLKIQYTDEEGGEDIISVFDFNIHYHSLGQ